MANQGSGTVNDQKLIKKNADFSERDDKPSSSTTWRMLTAEIIALESLPIHFGHYFTRSWNVFLLS
jgi:hypothetical protein